MKRWSKDVNNPLDSDEGTVEERVTKFYELLSTPSTARRTQLNLQKILFRYKEREAQLLQDMRDKYGGKSPAQIAEERAYGAAKKVEEQVEEDQEDEEPPLDEAAQGREQRFMRVTDWMMQFFWEKEANLESQIAALAEDWALAEEHFQGQAEDEDGLTPMDATMDKLSFLFFFRGKMTAHTRHLPGAYRSALPDVMRAYSCTMGSLCTNPTNGSLVHELFAHMYMYCGPLPCIAGTSSPPCVKLWSWCAQAKRPRRSC